MSEGLDDVIDKLNEDLKKKRKREDELVASLKLLEQRNAVLEATQGSSVYQDEWKKRSLPDLNRFLEWSQDLTGHVMDSNLRANLEKLFVVPEGTSLVNFLVEIMWTVETKKYKKDNV